MKVINLLIVFDCSTHHFKENIYIGGLDQNRQLFCCPSEYFGQHKGLIKVSADFDSKETN